MAEPTANGCAHIDGDDGYDVEVAGVSTHQDTVEFIVRGRGEKPADHKCQALLVPDPNNPDDPERVNVIILGRQVGYLPADVAEQMHEAMQTWSFAFATCDALIEGGWYRNNEDKGDFQVWLDLNPDFTPAAAAPTGQPAVVPAAAAVAAAASPAGGFTRCDARVVASAAGAALVVCVLFGVGWLLVPLTGTSTGNAVTAIASSAVPSTATTSASVPPTAVRSTTMTATTMTSAAVNSTAVTSEALASTTAAATLPSPGPTSSPSEVRDPPTAAKAVATAKVAAAPIEPQGKASIGIAAAPSKPAPPSALAASPGAAEKLLHPVAIMTAAPVPAPAVRAVAPPSTMQAVAEYEPAAAATAEAKGGSEHVQPPKRTHPAETGRSHRRAERERASRARTRTSRAHPSRTRHHYVPAIEREAPPMAPPATPRMIAPRLGETAAERVIRDSLNDWTRHGLPSMFNPPPRGN